MCFVPRNASVPSVATACVRDPTFRIAPKKPRLALVCNANMSFRNRIWLLDAQPSTQTISTRLLMEFHWQTRHMGATTQRLKQGLASCTSQALRSRLRCQPAIFQSRRRSFCKLGSWVNQATSLSVHSTVSLDMVDLQECIPVRYESP